MRNSDPRQNQEARIVSNEANVAPGFEDRVMFGTDQLIWPHLMAYSISIIQNADYLTPEQKRDILYNNAARFLRLDKKAAK